MGKEGGLAALFGSVTWLGTYMGKEASTPPAGTGRCRGHSDTLNISPAISGRGRPLKLPSCLSPATGRAGKAG